MNDSGNLINLLTTINLGVLAASLTLLALYPAIGAFITQQISSAEATTLTNYEKHRKRLFVCLALGIASSLISLIVLIAQAGVDYFGSIAATRFYWIEFPLQFSKAFLERSEFISLLFAIFLTVISLLFAARSAWLIFIAARDYI
jgi:hypothetical protein